VHSKNHQLNTQQQECVKACHACADICDRCADDMVGMDMQHDKDLMAACIRLCLDCSDICSLSARWMSRLSLSSESLCRLCADICERCAETCERHASHHPLCGECAVECRRCAAVCRDMVGATT
jgi:hypothetical protein